VRAANVSQPTDGRQQQHTQQAGVISTEWLWSARADNACQTIGPQATQEVGVVWLGLQLVGNRPCVSALFAGAAG
jgi:hypothetical protein